MKRRIRRIIGTSVALLLVAAPLLALGLRGSRTPARLGAEHGVEVLSLRRTAAGHLLDLRYRVLDPAKAARLLDRSEKLELREAAGGPAAPVLQTRLGAMRQTTMKPEAGRVYFAIFANPADAMVPGKRLTLKADDLEIRGIPVE